MTNATRKSLGHITFSSDGSTEFFEQRGEVFRASVTHAFDVHGRRMGRWECSVAHFERYRGVIVW